MNLSHIKLGEGEGEEKGVGGMWAREKGALLC